MRNIISQNAADNIAISLCILAAFLACRWAGEKMFCGKGGDAILARQRRFTLRAVTNALLAMCLLGVWLAEIQNLMFSLAAVMVALVVATKELLMCVAGAVLRLSGNLFKVGDRIQLNGLHGEVIDHGLFATTIMEMPAASFGHAGTGRRVMLPNSLLLAGPVLVEVPPRHFAPHRFTITLEEPVPLRFALSRLEAEAEAALAHDTERAMRFHRLAVAKAGVDLAGPGFDVSVSTSDLGKLQFHVMLYCLMQDAARLQQRVTVGFLDEVDVANEPQKPSDGWLEIARKLHEPRARSNAA